MTATVIISTVVVLAFWAASHFAAGAGFAIDAILLAIGWVMIGWGIFSALRSLLACLKAVKNANSIEDLNKAAEQFADALTQVGVDLLIGLLTRGAGRLRAKSSAKPDGGGSGSGSGSAGGAGGKSKADIEADNKAKAAAAKKDEAPQKDEAAKKNKADDPVKVGSKLHGREVVAVKQGNDDPIVLIGTKMGGDDGVIAVAEKLRAEGKNVEILEDGFLDGKTWDIDGQDWTVESAWGDMAKGKRWKDFRGPDKRIPDHVLPQTPMYKLNETWIKDLDGSGATIIDIGNPTNSNSIFYKMEQGSVTWN